MLLTEIVIISVDRAESPWPIEGEAIFEGDFATAFAAAYYPEDGEVEGLEFDISPSVFDAAGFKEALVLAILEFDE